MEKVYIYTIFNRLWHFLQVLFIIMLAITGFDIHFDKFDVFGYEAAIKIHNICGIGFLLLTFLSIFWHLTTGQWKHYKPTRKNVLSMVKFYTSGIFKGDPHPVNKSVDERLNPLQRLVYLSIHVLVMPLMFVTGFLYLFFDNWSAIGLEGKPLEPVALAHTFFAYALVAFIIGHLYLATTGHTPTSNFQAMVTGWDHAEPGKEEESAGVESNQE